MKVLVMESGGTERFLIRQAFEAGMHESVFVENAEHAWRLINVGEARFLIADAETSDVISSQLIRRVQAAGLPPVYFLLLTARDDLYTEADDMLRKPFKAVELQMRLVMGQRVLNLADSLSQTQDQLESMALYDPLTGILNQAAFNKLARGEVERARRSASALSVITVDIDNFKTLSDSYGTEAGQGILKTVAENIREHSRSYDCIGHWAGHQFIITLTNVNDQEAEKIARRIITGIRFTDVKLDGGSVDLSLSAGIAAVSKVSEATNLELLIERAQQALAEAKKSGGYQVHLATV